MDIPRQTRTNAQKRARPTNVFFSLFAPRCSGEAAEAGEHGGRDRGEEDREVQVLAESVGFTFLWTVEFESGGNNFISAALAASDGKFEPKFQPMSCLKPTCCAWFLFPSEPQSKDPGSRVGEG